MTEHKLRRNSSVINQKYLEYFLPTVLTAMANNIAVMVDSILVGQMVGSTSMAAINLLSPVIQLYFSLTILFGLGASTIISYAKGRDDKALADKIYTTAFFAMLVVVAGLMAVQFIFLEPIASMLTTIPELRSELIRYYVPVIIGTPFSLLLPSVVHCIRSDGRPTFASNLIIISNVINLLMDIVLMGPFKMGIVGSSVATVVGNIVAFGIMLTHFKNPGNTLHFDFFVLRSPGEFFRQLGMLFTTGISGALGAMLITVRMFFLNSLIQNVAGTEGMIAMSVISMCQIFVSAFVTGASQTMIPIVSMLLGEKDFTGIKYAFRKAFLILLVASFAIVAVIECMPELISHMFGAGSGEELLVVVPALRISSASFPGLAMSFLIMYYFMATKKRMMALSISIINGIVIIIPCAYLLSDIWGADGIWYSFIIAQYGTLLFIGVITLVSLLRSGGKYKNCYLLDETSQNELFSMSVDSYSPRQSVREYISGSIEITDEALKEKIITAALNYTLPTGGARGKAAHSDIRVVKIDGGYVIMAKVSGGEKTADSLGVQSLNEDISISRSIVLGMEQIRITIREERQNNEITC